MAPAGTASKPSSGSGSSRPSKLDVIAGLERTQAAGVVSGRLDEHDAIERVGADERARAEARAVGIGDEHAAQVHGVGLQPDVRSRTSAGSVRPSRARCMTAPPSSTERDRGDDDTRATPSTSHAPTIDEPDAEREARWTRRPACSPSRMPATSAPSAEDRTGRELARHTRDQVADVGEAALADAAHLLQVVDRVEAAALLALAHDRLRERRADAGQRLELGRGRGVEVERPGGHVGRRRRSRRLGLAGDRCGIGFADARHRDALPVGDGRGEVQALEVGVVGRAARGDDRVAHPRAGVRARRRRGDRTAPTTCTTSPDGVTWSTSVRAGRRSSPFATAPAAGGGTAARCSCASTTTTAATTCERDERDRDTRVGAQLLHAFEQRHGFGRDADARERRDPAWQPPGTGNAMDHGGEVPGEVAAAT